MSFCNIPWAEFKQERVKAHVYDIRLRDSCLLATTALKHDYYSDNDTLQTEVAYIFNRAYDSLELLDASHQTLSLPKIRTKRRQEV